MARSKLLFGLLMGALLAAPAAAGEPATAEKKCGHDSKDAHPNLERFKKLAGDWVSANPKEENLKGKVISRYRTTSGGSAVVETVFPGDEMEMVTVYTADGDQVALTHYCHLGNQPRMRSKNGDNKDELFFEFAGGGNLNPAKDTHMHDCHIRFVDADHIQGEWELYMDGKPAGKHAFDLIRKK